jgi:hypothetical protein
MPHINTSIIVNEHMLPKAITHTSYPTFPIQKVLTLYTMLLIRLSQIQCLPSNEQSLTVKSSVQVVFLFLQLLDEDARNCDFIFFSVGQQSYKNFSFSIDKCC